MITSSRHTAIIDHVDVSALRQRLLDLYQKLHAHYGYEPYWWPVFSDTPQFEIMVGAVLVQQTRWDTVEGAVVRLRDAALLTPEALATADAIEVAVLVRPCAFHSQKAQGLQAICRYVLQHYNGEVAPLLAQECTKLRAELLALPQIGPETADAILLYAGAHPKFVVDAYARRLFARLDLLPGFDFHAARYNVVQQLVEGALQGAIFDFAHLDGSLRHFLWDLHAMINEECIHHCLANKPRCDRPGVQRTFLDPRKCVQHCASCSGCPLRMMCAMYQAAHHTKRQST
ncbi:MAG: DNA repair protein [Chloroflexi bacterium AL-W]|nr:DNA repair protein [Chloroflexi bacterium AL-N5]NOK85405.1 DNA repair protein [Chloroflexi bacterium AL-W]